MEAIKSELYDNNLDSIQGANKGFNLPRYRSVTKCYGWGLHRSGTRSEPI